ncbi:MAG: ABC transporter permease [Planctomycetes bacterium]|nr:ABC transporter permease [Planctomycetota bacterium]
MIHPRFIPLVGKQLWRHGTRSSLTVLGVAAAMFLFVAVQTLQQGVAKATSAAAGDTTLVVYRENRFCPATSRLPEHYEERIGKIAGVASVVPLKIVVSNCRASLDVVTFRGVSPENADGVAKQWTLVEGSLDEWKRRSDAALVGERLAERRKMKVGQSFDSSGITVTIAGIIRSTAAQDQNVAYVHLDFIQRASRTGLGIVTQFNVRVDDPAKLEATAKAIDAEFRTDSEPTTTRPEKAFVAQAGSDIVEVVGFTRYLGWGCLAAVLALVANAIVLSVQDRIKEHAILQTLGFRGGLIARLIVVESVLLGLAGGLLGTIGAAALIHWGGFSMSAEGLSVNVDLSPRVLVIGLTISALVGVIAGLVPALRAGRRGIADCFRAV